MPEIHQFTSVTFRNYKALKQYTLSLGKFNVLVGPNNSGKSTIIGAFRILAEGMRKASVRKPEFIHISGEDTFGYRVPLEDLPVSTENIFSDYDDSKPAVIDFRLSGGSKLELIFPESSVCYLVCKPKGRQVRTPSDFKKEYKASVGFVPVLGPVEHKEPLYQKEAARKALLTHRASRNFRNIWYHYPSEFSEFREMIQFTWPGMDIDPPEIEHNDQKPTLYMFCPEERFPREIFWAGFGFQVWCQMLTFIVRAKNDSLLIIDEPDIYLHSDLQRQLVGILRNLNSDVLIATHSTEIVSEAEPGDLLIINKKNKSAKRIKDLGQLQKVFEILGSNLNPTLTQLAKSRRAVFVEGKDFQILAAFARKLQRPAVGNRSDFAVISIEGFNPKKISDLAKGIELTLGGKINKAVVLDRDYRSDEEITMVHEQLNKYVDLAHIHTRKEIENYLLEPMVLDRALKSRIEEYNKRTDDIVKYTGKVEEILEGLTTPLKNKISGQFLSRRSAYEKERNPRLDQATINQNLLEIFEEIWTDLAKRLQVIPGKEILAQLNSVFQERYKVSLSVSMIINAFQPNEVPKEIKRLIEGLEQFRKRKVD